MKTICDFCKTEYSVDNNLNGTVKCAVCGHMWVVKRAPQKNVLMVFLASLCALLASIVFAVVVILNHQAQRTNTQVQPLVANVTAVRSNMDSDGVVHFVVDGNVVNQSDEIYGVPNLIIVSYDENGKVIARQKFMSPATLLDAGATVPFSYTLGTSIDGVANVTVEFQTQGVDL